MGDDQENTRTILADLATHPNVGGVLVLGLAAVGMYLLVLRAEAFLNHLWGVRA